MTSNPIQLVVFDMAGTTVDEDNVVYKTVRKAINSAGYDYSLDQVLEFGAGKEKSQAIRDVLALDGNTHDENEIQDVFSNFKTMLAEAYDNLDVREQPAASEVFETLRSQGVKVVLNTGYDRATAQKLLDKIGWQIGQHIDGLVTASDVNIGRPSPEMIEKSMSITGVASNQAVAKVGDSQIDIEEGKNAVCGMTFGVTTGAQTESQLRESDPTEVVGSLNELLPWVLSEIGSV